MYTIQDYGDMILDRGRIAAYSNAFRGRVTCDSVVLDIGAGPGILTLLACQTGARKVYAVEPEGVIEAAREAAAASNFGDRVEFIQARSTEIFLAEKVDAIISSIQGALPLFDGSITAILDARDRFLKPGGFLIPERETLWIAPVNAPELYERIESPWRDHPGLDFQGARRRAANTWRKWRFHSAELLVEPQVWSVLDYRELQGLNAKGNAHWTMPADCAAQGLCVWFDCMTAPGCGFSNSPASGERHTFEQSFFPWPEACNLAAGDQVSVEIRADHVGEDYIWSWNTEIRGRDVQKPVKAAFRQSQLSSAPFSRDWLRKAAAAFVPAPNTEADIDRTILELFHAGISLEDISRRVAERFPERFPEWRKALTRVGEMSVRYSQ